MRFVRAGPVRDHRELKPMCCLKVFSSTYPQIFAIGISGFPSPAGNVSSSSSKEGVNHGYQQEYYGALAR
jgi:hypothetical protein